ncbi:MAG TPA: type II secretion system F family protein [Sedimentisphaerales bacterium]|nr:type II secretion system F family protein [Sedimentisphaerales bacterium]
MATDIALAYHNLATMLDAGVPMQRSLNVVAAGLKPDGQRAFLELAQAVANGNSLGETMACRPAVFDPLDVMVIRAAETSGSLPELLGLLAKWYEFRRRIKRRIFSGLTLPVLLIHLVAIFAPLPSYFLGGRHATAYIGAAVGILSLFYVPAGIAFVITRMTPKQGMLRRTLDRVAMRIPILGPAVYKLSLSRYCWVFHMLTRAGLPLTDCAEKAADAAGSTVVTDLVRPGAASAKNGNPVSAGFSVDLPVEFIDIWRIGEETGELDNVTRRLAEDAGEKAELLFHELASWLPRFVYGLVAVLMIYYIFRNLALIYGVAFQRL